MSTLLTKTMIDEITAGEHDKELSSILAAANARMDAIRATKTVAEFGIGDKVRINDKCGTRYLVGHIATVVGIKRTKIVIKLDTPTGRFARVTADGVVSADVVVPIGIVDSI
jgi:hypothetical protein